MTKKEVRTFISFPSANKISKALAGHIDKAIRNEGFYENPFIYIRDEMMQISPGESIDKTINDALDDSHVFIAITCAAYLASNPCMDECERFLENPSNKVPKAIRTIIQVRLEETKLSNIFPEISELMRIDDLINVDNQLEKGKVQAVCKKVINGVKTQNAKIESSHLEGSNPVMPEIQDQNKIQKPLEENNKMGDFESEAWKRKNFPDGSNRGNNKFFCRTDQKMSCVLVNAWPGYQFFPCHFFVWYSPLPKNYVLPEQVLSWRDVLHSKTGIIEKEEVANLGASPGSVLVRSSQRWPIDHIFSTTLPIYIKESNLVMTSANILVPEKGKIVDYRICEYDYVTGIVVSH